MGLISCLTDASFGIVLICACYPYSVFVSRGRCSLMRTCMHSNGGSGNKVVGSALPCAVSFLAVDYLSLHAGSQVARVLLLHYSAFKNFHSALGQAEKFDGFTSEPLTCVTRVICKQIAHACTYYTDLLHCPGDATKMYSGSSAGKKY